MQVLVYSIYMAHSIDLTTDMLDENESNLDNNTLFFFGAITMV